MWGYVVKNHPNIKTQQTQIRNQIKAAQEEMIKRREGLVKEAEKLKEFKEAHQNSTRFKSDCCEKNPAQVWT